MLLWSGREAAAWRGAGSLEEEEEEEEEEEDALPVLNWRQQGGEAASSGTVVKTHTASSTAATAAAHPDLSVDGRHSKQLCAARGTGRVDPVPPPPPPDMMPRAGGAAAALALLLLLPLLCCCHLCHSLREFSWEKRLVEITHGGTRPPRRDRWRESEMSW
ncbi:hypothetical protein EYF80_059615 [Liparis tanakae]|uniref:Uncharacterized protein n=1 Tax=Liparis tanakae TaxID=230148 RepID=A0A4Z2EN50_9TELE|nr:hypothetical protein EYF80_059615 [Liparis tanakae]